MTDDREGPLEVDDGEGGEERDKRLGERFGPTPKPELDYPDLVEIKGEGYGGVSVKNKRERQEDRMVVSETSWGLVAGVFDGYYKGAPVAEYLKEDVPKYVIDAVESQRAPKQKVVKDTSIDEDPDGDYVIDAVEKKEDMSWLSEYGGDGEIPEELVGKARSVRDAMIQVQEDLYDDGIEGVSRTGKEIPGSTGVVAALLPEEEQMIVAWVGDSTASVKFGSGYVKQLTEDHVTRGDDGLARLNRSYSAGRRSINPQVVVVQAKAYRQMSHIVLASDGAKDHLRSIREHVGESASEFEAAREIVKDATRKTRDNITAVVVSLVG